MDNISLLAAISGSLSFVGASFIIANYCFFPDLRRFNNRLILYIAICDLLSSVSYIIIATGVTSRSMGWCIAQGANMQVFELASIFWTLIITIHLIIGVKFLIRSPARFERYYHIIAWTLPVASFVILMGLNAFGYAGNWCWIKPELVSLRFAFFYAPLLLIFFTNLIAYIVIIQSVRVQMAKVEDLVASRDNKVTLGLQLKLSFFLLAFFIVWIIPVINRIYMAFTTDGSSPTLNYLQAFFNPLAGLLNAIVYGFTEQLVNRYKQVLKKVRHGITSKIGEYRASINGSGSTEMGTSTTVAESVESATV